MRTPPAPRRRALASVLAVALGAIGTASFAHECAEPEAGGTTACEGHDDFPTTAIADYVLGCMAANGNTYIALQQCSCSIDFIRERMDYATYEQASTVLSVQRDTGQRGLFYRDSNWAKSRIEALENLQAESTLRCF